MESKENVTQVFGPLNVPLDRQDNAADHELGFVSSFYQECQLLLSKISKDSIFRSGGTLKRQFQESISRFVLWGSGWDEGRLDFCLGGSIQLRNNVTELLWGLAKALLQLCSTSGKPLKPAIQEHVRILNSLIGQARGVGMRTDSDSEASDSDFGSTDCESSSKASDTRRKRRSLKNIEFYTICLMELLPSMEQTYKNVCDPGLHLEEGNTKISFHVTEAARPYVLQIHDKFRKANTSLVERLGEANWQRFIRIRQYEAPKFQEDECAGARSTFVPASKFHDSGLGTSAPTVASHSSFVSSIAGKEDSCVRVPPTPDEVAEGLPFECFICKQTLSKIKTRIDWKIHVFADLQPYICTFDRCRSMLVTFPTRKIWSEHEFREHRICHKLKCHLCSTIFDTQNSLIEHLQLNHNLTPHHSKLLAKSPLSKSSELTSLENEQCPLCLQGGWSDQRKFVKHVARHLEAIALSVLPREIDSDSDPQSDDGSSVELINVSGYVYYCCICGYGPQMVNLHPSCGNCGQKFCSRCIVRNALHKH